MQWTALVLVEFLLTLKRLKCPAVPLIEVQIRGYWSLSSDAGPNDFATFSNLTVNVRCVWGKNLMFGELLLQFVPYLCSF